jgi:hypothetical protein
VFSKILSTGAEKVATSIGQVFDNLFTSKEEKLQIDLAKTQILLEAQRATNETAVELEKAYLAESANLREQIKVELQSEDWFVRRARPASVWLGVIILINNYIIFPYAHLIKTGVVQLLEPSEWFWGVWGTLVLGYGYFRTRDKQSLSKTLPIPLSSPPDEEK